MGALANLVALDAETTPVSHTFVPLGPDANGVQWFEQTNPAAANPAAAKRISISIRRAKPADVLKGVARITIQLWSPIMETLASNDAGITPPPTVAYQLFARIEYVFPERSTEQERKNVRVLLANMATNNGIILDVIQKLQPLF